MLNDTEYDMISARKDFHWYCTGCEPKVLQSIQIEKDVEKKLAEFMAKVEYKMKTLEGNVYKKMNDLEEKLGKTKSTIEHELEVITQELTARPNLPTWKIMVDKQVDDKIHEVNDNLTEVKTSIDETKKLADENKDKERRARNIIIYRVKESRDERPGDRTACDRNFCKGLFNDAMDLECDNDDIVRTVRLGKKQDNSDRPLLVELATRSFKNEIMENLFRLRDADQVYKDTSIVHDMTQAEREQCKETVLEARRLQAAETGEYIYRARGPPGKMVAVKLRK